jgi:S-(hydroxymethyl)glutathione dehydrogenase/alcohol dehydrogenase
MPTLSDPPGRGADRLDADCRRVKYSGMRAAILWTQGEPLSVEPIELAAPGPGEVLVEVKAAGVCHSDLHPARGEWRMRTPVVLGHEGAGIVRALGPGVTTLHEGDHVVFCWTPACGHCPACADHRPILCDRLEKMTYRNKLPNGETRLRARDQAVAPFLGTACFAEAAVVPHNGAIAVSKEVPFEILASLGCAVLTGVGAVTNGARVPAGASVAIIGAGGVGLNVVQGARLAEAGRIIAVDRQPAALALAGTFGATDLVAAGEMAVGAVRELTQGRGADYVFDTVGTPATLGDALVACRKGGTVVLTGLSRTDAQSAFPMFPFVMQEKTLRGSVYGSGDPSRDIPWLVTLYQEGRLLLRELVARRYRLDDINDALDALAAGVGARGVIVM